MAGLGEKFFPDLKMFFPGLYSYVFKFYFNTNILQGNDFLPSATPMQDVCISYEENLNIKSMRMEVLTKLVLFPFHPHCR